MSKLLINHYLNELSRLKQVSGTHSTTFAMRTASRS